MGAETPVAPASTLGKGAAASLSLREYPPADNGHQLVVHVGQ